MLATEELRRGRFWPTSSGSRSLKSLVATGVGALHGRGPQKRPCVRNAFMMDAQDWRGEICILFLWRRVREGGLWEWCASSPAGSGNGGPRSCLVGDASLAVSLLLHAGAAGWSFCEQAGAVCSMKEGRRWLYNTAPGLEGLLSGCASARQLNRRLLTAVQ
jgi:hypothetical protein